MLDSKLDFNENINNKIIKCNKIISAMKKLLLTLWRKTLLTIYKSFVRPNLDYAYIIYDNPLNQSFKNKLEKVWYRVALVISVTFKGISREHLYEELGLDFLLEGDCLENQFFSIKF